MYSVLKRSILLTTILLGLTLGWIMGQKTSAYVLFFTIEPILFPCPYNVDENVVACPYRRHEPGPDIAVWWHRWPAPEGQPSFPQSRGNWVRDILFFDPPPLLDQSSYDLDP